MSPGTLVAALDYGSVLIFALTGALVASRAQLDPVGFVFMAALTAVGGGTLRDLLLGRATVFWVAQPAYVMLAAGAALVVFWTAHLIESRYRLLIWLDSVALSVAVAAKDAVHFIGLPEGNTALAQAAIYLATALKSNAIYTAYAQAAEDAHRDVAEPVPLHLRNAPTDLMKTLGYGKGYRYAHTEQDGVASMSCLPPALQGRTYYRPTDRGFEKEIADRLAQWGRVKKKKNGTED